MFNRYVDGLASFTPADDDTYTENGKANGKRICIASTENLKEIIY
jgi:hypothetical protein